MPETLTPRFWLVREILPHESIVGDVLHAKPPAQVKIIREVPAQEALKQTAEPARPEGLLELLRELLPFVKYHDTYCISQESADKLLARIEAALQKR